MKIVPTPIDGLFIIEPIVFEDERGYFFESYNRQKLAEALPFEFVQDNESKSSRGVLRGLHYQLPPYDQAKLVRVIEGEVLDVAVDVREDSPTYGQWHSVLLSAENKRQFFVPRGFAHGYCVYSSTAIFSYKCDNYYMKSAEGGIHYADSQLAIDWGLEKEHVLVSEKDSILPVFGEHLKFQLQ